MSSELGKTVNHEKLKELILYVASRCDNDRHYGAVKLNKILFFADFASYLGTGRSITGEEYRKYEHGPCPAAMKGVKQELEKNLEAYEYINPLDDGKRQKRLLPRRSPKLDLFSADDIAAVEGAIDALRGETGREASERSHRFPGWQHARMNEPIPYHTALIPDPQDVEFTDEERDWVMQSARHLGAE